MAPLSDVLKVVTTVHKPQFRDLVLKYKEKFLSTGSSIDEFEQFIRKILPEVDKAVSPMYKSKVLNSYFTDYGLVMIMHDAIREIYMSEYDEMSKSF